jgi:hypothetical protein
VHGAEFENLKFLPGQTTPLLPEKKWPWRLKAMQNPHDNAEPWQDEKYGHAGHKEIK